MTCGAIYFQITVFLALTEGKMDWGYYCRVFEERLLPVVDDIVSDVWMLQKDSASVRIDQNIRKTWISDNDVQVLQWPRKSPVLNRIENVWAMLVRAVYNE